MTAARQAAAGGRARRWWRRVAIGLAGVIALAAVGLAAYAWRALPPVDGERRVDGLAGPVRIERDADGVPTIHAASSADALFGLGYVHAQDRLWQLEMHRRIGAGRLAEAVGPAALDTDRFLRALGVRRAAAAQWERASLQARSLVSAYTAGINAWIAEMPARPPEFVVLGLSPEPWSPVDTLSWAIMMAWDLGGNWNNELLRMRLSLALPVSRIDELLPPYPGERSLPVADYAALYRALKVDARLGETALRAAPESGVEGVGSNNWVLDGSRTASGRPLLANDPHLKLTTPALWYFARLDAPDLKVAGATLPALPIVVLGQNEHIAWGYTNTAPDVQDLYLERIDPDDPGRYQTPGGWARFDTWQEVIRVRGGADVAMTVRATRHGPVISDAGAGEGLTGPARRPTYALAMRWTALDPDPGTLDAGLAFNRAESVDAFIAASAAYLAPMQNMVVADRDGHIGEVSAGRVPLRRPDNDLRGQVPAPGWDARYDWAGYLDPAATPRERDPARGWIATANQRIHGPDYPHYLTSEWAPPYRQQRIEALLEATPRHDLASLRRIQSDQVSLATRRLLPFLAQVHSSHPLAAAARRQLQGFDGTMAADAAAPLIFYAWVRQLTQAVFADEIGARSWERSNRAFRDALEGVLERNDGWWCDDKGTPAVETCAQQMDAAFDRALDELSARHGSDVARWRWGDAHVARAEHRPFSHVAPLARWFELRAPVGGDTYTVNVGRVGLVPDRDGGGLYAADHAPSMRALYDLGDPLRSTFMTSSGQSGLVFSPLYRNLLGPWARGEMRPLWAAPAVHTLTLRPAAAP